MHLCFLFVDENRRYLFSTVCLVLAAAVSLTTIGSRVTVARSALVDPEAEPLTQNLFHNLRTLEPDRILFGHQDSTLYGVGWKDEPNKSDVFRVVGAFPAVYGWDLFDLKALRDQGPDSLKDHVEKAFRHGGVNTFSWHMWNPVTGQNFYDTTRAVYAILPGGSRHEQYRKDLDLVSTFFKGLKGAEGNAVPILFRPFHEHTGNWFWWGQSHCTRDEFIRLWRFTVEYMRDQKGLHNLLYVYSPGNLYGGEEDYFERYPGDDHVDVLGYDYYGKTLEPALPTLRRIVEEAGARGKISALTECGYPEGMSRADRTDYYTRGLLWPLKRDLIAQRVAYMLVWRNAHADHFWIPYPGHVAEHDFKVFYRDQLTVFGDKLPDLYRQPISLE